ncbi:uncharacterized protein LOC114580865 [Dendrobium catenatum]|uniref:uncharacterized protein LOC114580865 n=1 Tax=Dendrobium catenatum TaxID=906689 RepID=UPI00109FE94E|nr:uncharacterized protein LOC114580865 [Dendrobium catenatum]
MIVLRPFGSLRGRGSNGIVIREGFRPLSRQDPVEGKGKKVLVDDLVVQKNVDTQGNPGLANLDSSVSDDVADVWPKPKPIKITFNRDHVKFSEDGVTVRLKVDREAENSRILKNSIMLKVLGNNVSFSVCSLELRRQWRKHGGFHLTSIGMNWILCSFKTSEVVDEILNGGLWYVNGFIVGMDRWTPMFDPDSFKGISAPIWIRLSCFLLYCWDEDSIARIGSFFGSPMYIDGNTFRWSKREFARVCVRIDLEKKVPNGVWVEGSAGRFFQRVEYEKIDLLCYQCGKVGHDNKICSENVTLGIHDQTRKKTDTVTMKGMKIAPENNPSVISAEYGMWIHVHLKNRRFKRDISNGRGVKDNGNNTDNRFNNSHQDKVLERVQTRTKVAEVVEESVVAPVKSSINMETAGVEMFDIQSTNHFALLVDKDVEEGTEKHGEIDKALDGSLDIPEIDANHIDLGSHNGVAKIKLAKELRSLGPVEPDYKKKKRDGRGDKKRKASLYLKEIVRDQDVFFVGLMETKKLVTFDVMEATSQAVIGNLSVPILGTWRIAIVYGNMCCKERGGLWSQLEKSMENAIPSITGGRGGFNYIINKEEKRGGKKFLFSKGPSVGPRFTWCNNKEGASQIWERLDRCMLNSIAIQKIPLVVTRHLARMASDHYPIVVKMDEEVRFKSKAIRFEDTWSSYPTAKSIVYHSWKKNDFGDEYMILQRKLSRTLKSLFFWNKNKCKDLNVLKEKLKKEILKLQNKEALGVNWSVDDLFVLRNKVHELNVTLKRLSTWWNQRAKARWHEEGNTNSKLFHNYASARRNGNRIIQIKDELNNLYDKDEQIEKKIAANDMDVLNAEFSVNELHNSVFQQGNNKSPSLDGVTSSFYKREWKNTLIVLISKIKNPVIPSNFRPISLCQTNYKIVATMLVNRWNKVISKMISEDQVAFIHGRSIIEHCLLAQ